MQLEGLKVQIKGEDGVFTAGKMIVSSNNPLNCEYQVIDANGNDEPVTQLSNVPMQPKPDATEHPLTLIEKLRNRGKEWASNPHYWMDFNLIGDVFNDVIDIVKQHQSWRIMPSDEKPQDMQAYNLLLKNDSAGYPTLYSVGLFRQYASGHVWLSLVEAETYIDESKILAWQPMNMPSDDFFESLEQPPSEVQDD